MRLLLVNWQDIENPQAGGAEIHLHEIFGRLARRGHAVTLLCGGWPGCPSRVTIDGMDVHRVGTRQSFGALAYPYFFICSSSSFWVSGVREMVMLGLYQSIIGSWMNSSIQSIVSRQPSRPPGR